MAKRGANIQRRMFQRITAGPETRVECPDHFLSSWRIRTDKYNMYMTIYMRNSEGEGIMGAQFQFGETRRK